LEWSQTTYRNSSEHTAEEEAVASETPEPSPAAAESASEALAPAATESERAGAEPEPLCYRYGQHSSREIDESLKEIDRAINKLGLRGIEILSNINGRDLDVPELMPLYKEVETLDLPVFIHPGGKVGSERTKDYYLTNLVAYPFDTALAAAHLIFGGILDKCPNLKFCLAHGGGNLPYIRGRLEHGYQVRSESKAVIKQPPSHYFPLLYFDTITHFTPALEYLITSAGADKVLMGTDYPYDMADSQPVLTVQNLKNISEEDKQLVLGGNARRIFKL